MSLVEETRPSGAPAAVSASTPLGDAAADRRLGERRSLRGDFRGLLRIAIPVVLAEIGWISMGIVDVLMVSPLGPEAIGAAGLAGSLSGALSFFGMGALLGLDTLVSQAYGARRLEECHRWLFHGVALAVIMTVPLTLVAWAVAYILLDVGLHPAVAPLASSYLFILTFGLLPLLLYAACRRYLQAVSFVTPVTFALVSANLVNAGLNWIFIYGHFGFSALGTDGSARATALARVYMATVLIAAVVWHNHRSRGSLWRIRTIEWTRIRRLLTLGGPAAAQLLLEIGVFAAAAALAGTLSPVALAAHQIALQFAALTFMVPFGVASAGAVLVGQAIGRHDPHGATRAGWLALGLGSGFMASVALVLLAIPSQLMHLFTTDATVIATGVMLLRVAAVFQLFDGLQAVATGVLRGTGDTRTPMIANLVGHWFIGLPFGWWVCFAVGWGVVGLWVGLSVGLIVCGVALVITWARATRRLYLVASPVVANTR